MEDFQLFNYFSEIAFKQYNNITCFKIIEIGKTMILHG